MASYLNEFIETIQGVPDEVQRNFCLMRDLDKSFTTQQRDLLALQDAYMADLRKRHADEGGLGTNAPHLLKQEQKLNQIRALHQVTLQHADEKIAVANQSYDLVDEHIKRLDVKLKQFERELTESGHFNRAYSTGAVGAGNEFAQAVAAVAGGGGAGAGAEKKSGRKADRAHRSAAEKSRNRKRKADQHAALASQTAGQDAGGAEAGAGAGEVLYCTCRRPYIGQMVACENEDCEISWYHFDCVGLTEQPAEDEKWYCATCLAQGFGGD